ncbi:chemotaxis protein [Pseudoalteromonas sp. MSK9-3]|uniref:chemotaxis protein n=1 Tax=Pseudoalteromonas sp. MSK9-3 TaxID=1897633 RepID=UPI000E6BD71D|nr:chemotaxis protein [Pseudoalteromonas sp. MSK9-3]RJE73382.1 chemotaxis protein [Pseudoalteromonas sp. MSK9-3]
MISSHQATMAINNFVRVANIITNLDTILSQAKNLSLTAKNARVVALRAGDAAFGFKPITNFIDEFSTQTIKTTSEISKLSNQLFSLALAVVRCTDLQHQLNKANSIKQHKCIVTLQQQSLCDLKQKTRALEQAIFSLESYFEDIQKQMRSAEYIAVTSRVEASNAGEFSHSLESVSDFITNSARKIKTAVNENLQEIYELRGALR